MTDPTWIPSSVAQIELHCTNLAHAEDFYCNRLGLTLAARLPQIGSIFVRCGELSLIIREQAPPRIGSTIYFNADGNVFDAIASLRASGIGFTEEPDCIAHNREGSDVWLGFFADPWGNPLAIIGNMPATSVAP